MFGSWESIATVVIVILIAYAVVLSIGAIYWTYRDVLGRTRDGWAQAVSVLLVAVFNMPGLLLYLVLRPHETLNEAYERRVEAEALGDTLLGVIVTRQAERVVTAARKALEDLGLRCLAVLPEDRLLAGPTPREMAETLHASRLVDTGEEDEAVEFVMLGPVSADPGQPYFLQHSSKAVVNRFDKMDLHLAALATEPDCLILTGGQQPSPYLLDRLGGGDTNVTVLLSPENTVRTVELVDELYGRTRFFGRRKVARVSDLVQQHVDIRELALEIG